MGKKILITTVEFEAYDLALQNKFKEQKTALSNLTVEDLNGSEITTDELNYLSGVKSNIQSQIEAKAPVVSPVFTGSPKAPTATPGTKDTQIATTEFVDSAIEKAKSEIKASQSAVYTPKGSVDSFDELPKEGNSAGDVYNVEAAFEVDGKKYPAGTNVAYTAEGKWDPLGGQLDLTDYAKTAQVTEMLKSYAKTSDLENFVESDDLENYVKIEDIGYPSSDYVTNLMKAWDA